MQKGGRQNWETPSWFFDQLDAEFGFTLDACADMHNAKCSAYLNESDNALLHDWHGVVWCNPPYGIKVGRWVKYAYEQARKGALVVLLIPASTDTRWWHNWVMRAREIRFVKTRIAFVGGGRAPFPSAIVVFDGTDHMPRLSSIAARE